MATFKNSSGHPIDMPMLGLHIPDGDTFEVPDELAASLEDRPEFAKSRTQNPTVTLDPATVEAVTGPIAVADATVTPAVTTTTN